ncbi:hypothetical protein [Sphingobacterium daejeonense]|uniref:hypothetical protein n=1 Tax=Sphingobacterium daejeonense TaxID=371142 RepID=UPI0010FD3034|nr:hypothetical protein [Sphingobacterium daejeonense]
MGYSLIMWIKCQELRDAENGETLIKQYKAEAKYLRAYYYWLMMKSFGPVVILPVNEEEAAGDNYQNT